MSHTKLDKRFFNSTRGRIVSLLRGSTKTVNELAEELELTDNAVRAHLLSLERDGLVRQGGVQRGKRKPHFSYELAGEAENLFPKAYDKLFNQLIAVLKGRVPTRTLREILREVGRSLAGEQNLRVDLSTRIKKALLALETIGGSPRLDKENGKLFIRSTSCPLSSAVSEHPEVCKLAESLLSEIIGTSVREQCDRIGPPRCSFAVTEK